MANMKKSIQYSAIVTWVGNYFGVINNWSNSYTITDIGMSSFVHDKIIYESLVSQDIDI